MSSGRLADTTAMITGGGAGIGRAAALRFASEGASVVVVDRFAERAEATAATICDRGGKATSVGADVTDNGDLDHAFSIADGVGPLRVLFTCAGGSSPDDADLVDSDPERWREALDVNLLAVMATCRRAVPRMVDAGGGSIVNVASLVALRGGIAGDAYSASKGAIISLTRSLAARHAHEGIRANAIAPGTVLTERVMDRMGMTAPTDPWPDALMALSARHPFSVAQPDDIANVALFLASEESRAITGAVIAADGGLTAY